MMGRERGHGMDPRMGVFLLYFFLFLLGRGQLIDFC